MTQPNTAGSERRRGRGRPKGGTLLANRAQLLKAAEQAIDSLGPEVTMDQIAAQAHVTKPILYRRIGDRDAVIDALSDLLVDRIVGAVAASGDSSAAPRDVFTAAMRAYLTAVGKHRNLYLFVNAAGQRTGPLRRRIDRSSDTIMQLFATASEGPGATTSPLTWSHSIVGALQTVTLMWIDAGDTSNDQRDRTVESIAVDLTQLLWPGVEAILAAGRGVASIRGDSPLDD